MLLLLGLLNELASIVVILARQFNAFNYNLYVLAEGLLILWQFYRWQAFRSRRFYHLLQAGLTGLWCWESFIYGSLFQFHSWYLIGYCSLTVLLGIGLLNRIVYMEPFGLYKNARYLICMGWMIFCLYSIIVEVFWLHGLSRTAEFRIYVLSILPLVDLVSNLLFTLAVLCIPYSYRYIMQC